MGLASSPGTHAGPPVERFEWVRALGASAVAVPTWLAIDRSAGASGTPVAVERVPRKGTDAAAHADVARNARALVTLRHPNVGKVREVLEGDDEVLVVRELIEGVRLRELLSSATPAGLEIALRALVDVLSGLSAVHNLKTEEGRGPNLIHGQLTPDCIFVTVNGSTRLIVPSRLPGSSRSGGFAYSAPELLLEDDEADARTDVFSVGVILWEAISGKRLFGDMQPSAIVTQLLGNRIEPASAPADMPWAAALSDVASRALMPDAAKRFSSAVAMATELRRVAAGRVALASRVAAHVAAVHGDTIRERTAALREAIRPAAAHYRGGRPPSGQRAAARAGSLVTEIELSPDEILEESPAPSRPTPVVPPPLRASTRPHAMLGISAPTPVAFPVRPVPLIEPPPDFVVAGAIESPARVPAPTPELPVATALSWPGARETAPDALHPPDSELAAPLDALAKPPTGPSVPARTILLGIGIAIVTLLALLLLLTRPWSERRATSAPVAPEPTAATMAKVQPAPAPPAPRGTPAASAVEQPVAITPPAPSESAASPADSTAAVAAPVPSAAAPAAVPSGSAGPAPTRTKPAYDPQGI